VELQSGLQTAAAGSVEKASLGSSWMSVLYFNSMTRTAMLLPACIVCSYYGVFFGAALIDL